jgi:hypothetical protein
MGVQTLLTFIQKYDIEVSTNVLNHGGHNNKNKMSLGPESTIFLFYKNLKLI